MHFSHGGILHCAPDGDAPLLRIWLFLLAGRLTGSNPLDFITSVSSVEARLDSVASTTEGSGEGAEHDHYRSGLSSKRSAGSVFRYGDRRDRRTATEPQRWRGRAFLSRSTAKTGQGACRDRGHRTCTLV